jgi:hypothetical protein
MSYFELAAKLKNELLLKSNKTKKMSYLKQATWSLNELEGRSNEQSKC